MNIKNISKSVYCTYTITYLALFCFFYQKPIPMFTRAFNRFYLIVDLYVLYEI